MSVVKNLIAHISPKLRRVIQAVFKVLLTAALIFVIAGCVVACVLTVYVATTFNGQASLPDVDVINDSQTSVIMTMNQKTGEYEEFCRLDGIQQVWQPISAIPANMQNAVIAIEDERFNEHYGVDWKRTVLACANLVLHYNSTEFGGSTITQQLVKNLTGNDEHNIQRKLTEIFTAVEMEKYYTKEEILQAYLNILPLTGQITGVGAGANYYFAKDVQDLTLAECAAIASITNNPSKYDPYRHPKALMFRQRTVLQKMHELGFITSDEYQQALGEELYFSSNAKATKVYDYYTDMLIDDVIAKLQKTFGYTETYAKNMVFYGGLTIYSCEDVALQAKAEAVYADSANFPDHIATDEKDPQAAIFVMDYTGKAVAVVGGRGEKTASRVFNRAVSALRQPGSAMKPIGVYAPAVQLNLINFSSPIPNCYITLRDGTKWPANYNQSRPANSGMTVIDIALQSSMNTAAAQIMTKLTPERSFDFLTGSLKISSLVTDDGKGHTDIDYAPMTLGGLTNGVYPREVAAAYQIFGNGGYYNEPYSFTKITKGGKTLLTAGPTNVQVLDADSAYIMNRLLQHVVTGGYGATAGFLKKYWPGWELFAKTGTTQQNNDVWLVAGTPKYVAASWLGYDNNQKLSQKQTSGARNLWNKTMLALHEGEEPMNFSALKAGTVEARFCYESGGLATTACKKTGIGVYKAGQLPPICEKHGGEDNSVVIPSTAATAATTTTAAQ